jgi:predicted dehydrogenase
MTDAVRFALVGAGGVARSYAQAFADCDEVRVVAVADVVPQAAQSLANQLGCPAFADHVSLVRHGPDFDAVVICTPPASHETLSTWFLQRGIAVLCEKPFTLDSASARRMAQAAAAGQSLLTMAAKFRFVADLVEARRLLRAGVLGTPLVVENVFAAQTDMRHRWNSDPAISGGGVWIDNGSHAADIMRFLLGPLAEVMLVEGRGTQGLAVEETVQFLGRNREGVLALSQLSWSLTRDQNWFVSIYGSEGCVQVGWKQSRYRTHNSPTWTVFGSGYNKVEAFQAQLLNFARAWRGQEELRITLDDALASVAVIEAGYQALRKGCWVRVEEPGREGSSAADACAPARCPAGEASGLLEVGELPC